MRLFKFWRSWLIVVGACLILFGLLLAFFNQSPLFDLVFNDQIDPVFWQPNSMDASDSAFQSWAYGVLGATLAGWGVMLTSIILFAFDDRTRWAWYGVVLSLVVWYFSDTLISYSAGAMFNVTFNTIAFVMAALPLGFTYPIIFRKN